MNARIPDRPNGDGAVYERLERARSAIEHISAPVAVDAEAVLRRRAQEMAARPTQQEDVVRRLDVVEFVVAGEHYCLPTAVVVEVYPLARLTPIPCVPDFIRGIINVRGRMVSAVDLRHLFDLPSSAPSASKVVIVKSGVMEMGILADEVSGVDSIAADRLQTGLPTLDGRRAEYLLGVTPDQKIVLDAEHLLSDERLVVREER